MKEKNLTEPNLQAAPKKRKKWPGILLIVIGVIIFASAFGGGSKDEKKKDNDKKVEDTKQPAASNADDDAKNEDDSIPKEYKSALKKAKNYSKTMHMSKAGIYAQLTSEYGEKFSEEAAQYAMDNLEGQCTCHR